MTYLPILAEWSRRQGFRFTIHEVSSWSERRGFARCPRRIYRGDPYWLPYFSGDVLRLLDPARNPGLTDAEVRLFVAVASDVLSGEDVIGRVAAIVHPAYNALYGEEVGLWAAFESVNRPEVTAALLTAAEEWLMERLPGLAAVRGPVPLDLLRPAGILADGFAARPAVLMPYHPPYYAELIAAAGHVVVGELLAYRLDLTSAAAPGPLDRPPAHVTVVPEPGRLTLDTLSASALAPDGSLWPFLSATWPALADELPLTDAALAVALTALARLADTELSAAIHLDGQLAAIALTLPDVHPRWPSLGRWWKHLPWTRPTGVRILPVWADPERYDVDLATVLYAWILAAAARHGYRYAEISPVSPEDISAVTALERLGGRVTKRYLQYEKRLTTGPADTAASDDDLLW